jgi:hypothetical protein
LKFGVQPLGGSKPRERETPNKTIQHPEIMDFALVYGIMPEFRSSVASGILPDVEGGILPPGKGGRNIKPRQIYQPSDSTRRFLSAGL